MKRGAVLPVILIVLLTTVAAAIVLAFTLKGIRDSLAQEQAKCIGINLEVTRCHFFPAGTILPQTLYQTTADGVYGVVERGYGGGEISGLRIIFTDTSGKQHSEVPVDLGGPGFLITTQAIPNLVEHSALDFAVIPLPYTPDTVTVAAVVGTKTVCEPTALPIPCSQGVS